MTVLQLHSEGARRRQHELMTALVLASLPLLATTVGAAEPQKQTAKAPTAGSIAGVESQIHFSYSDPDSSLLPEGAVWQSNLVAAIGHRTHDLNSKPLVQEGLYVIAYTSERERLSLGDPSLSDSKGFALPVAIVGCKTHGSSFWALFKMDDAAALEHLRHDDPEYYLQLVIPIAYDGHEGSLVIPRITLTLVSDKQPGPDTYPGALLLWLQSLIVLGIVMAAMAFGLRALIARLRKKSAKDGKDSGSHRKK